jgi:2-oxoglutarate decarboxylase
VLDRYPNAADVRWVQDEPANQGAWPYLGLELPAALPDRLAGVARVSRRRMAATAAGSSHVHDVEQAALLDDAYRRRPAP